MSFRGRGGFRGHFPPQRGGRGHWGIPDGDQGCRQESGNGFRGRGKANNNINLSPHDVLSWIDHQPPWAVQRVMYHCQWLLHQYGFPGGEELDEEAEDESTGGQEEGPSGSWYSSVPSGPDASTARKRPGFGYLPSSSGSAQIWTPSGWVPKDNSHKITTKMKPLPPQEIIPPFSNTYPESAKDKEKLRLLLNNHSMMSAELSKICSTLKVSSPPTKEEDLSEIPDDQREKVTTAYNCVSNALKTLDEFKDFLQNEKYKDWNAEQKAVYDEKVKSMIGETPSGIPYKKKKKASNEDVLEENKSLDEKADGN
eukprot:TRINITY_DN7145_c0_g1_i2.p1 TRINITY_DN7145_c0_g1~~TRINITY_DN7145_c0_g1_i2.p1  ORF type:complete len:311 (-),score=96.31 TRINITY_DN7145_c0_g1_i2:165-1097(-)